jgi:hypothetical protein
MSADTNEIATMPWVMMAHSRNLPQDENLYWPLAQDWLYSLALFGNGAEGL